MEFPQDAIELFWQGYSHRDTGVDTWNERYSFIALLSFLFIGGKIIPEDLMGPHIVRLWNSRRARLNYPGKDTATGTLEWTHGMSRYSFIA
ncbi:hypothetical protein CEXT_193541 [Caerostris extrusa]|uniref:Aminotransferase-like plant mobile domain-containing protein n=1 Tax=Caerostris extrusa TaxID=172846 RepID=A0AAV4WUA7_CAEEX|nr:hypothetical protein CEXT_193541 [Caerostris extrusa]